MAEEVNAIRAYTPRVEQGKIFLTVPVSFQK
jgi:hypothetical protein